MKLSNFGNKFTARTGILGLMDDLGVAMASGERMLMLGGGNPGQIPAVEQMFRRRMQAILDTPGAFEHMVGSYDLPTGSRAFREALARLLAEECGWQITERNIALTNGSQSAFFMLFNMLAGPGPDGESRKILLPLAPEYIGYADTGLAEPFFTAVRPSMEIIDEHSFKYHVDFDAIRIGNDIGAICVSRPTNPTGNVLSDAEIERLIELAAAHDLPLIIDNAYGTPFPNIIFTAAKATWSPGLVVSMSLSKLGLPGVRTGIVVADEPIIEALGGINAIINLATGNFGAALATDLVQSGELITLSREIIRPFYERKAAQAVEFMRRELDGIEFYIHKVEGAFFLWLWLVDLPISSEELYQRLKRRQVLVIAGHHFFPGLDDDWTHKHECIRVNYALDWEIVSRGLAIVAEEVKRAHAEAGSASKS